MEKMTINNKYISSNKSPYYLGFLFVIFTQQLIQTRIRKKRYRLYPIQKGQGESPNSCLEERSLPFRQTKPLRPSAALSGSTEGSSAQS